MDLCIPSQHRLRSFHVPLLCPSAGWNQHLGKCSQLGKMQGQLTEEGQSLQQGCSLVSGSGKGGGGPQGLMRARLPAPRISQCPCLLCLGLSFAVPV